MTNGLSEDSSSRVMVLFDKELKTDLRRCCTTEILMGDCKHCARDIKKTLTLHIGDR